MRRVLAYIFLSLVSLPLLVGILLLFTQLGLSLVVGAINLLSPIHIDYKEISGRVAQELRIQDLSLVLPDQTQIELHEVVSQLQPSSLLGGKIEFKQLLLQHVRIIPAPEVKQQSKDKTPSLADFPTIPIVVQIHHFELNDLSIGATPESPPLIEHLYFQFYADKHEWSWTESKISTPTIQLYSKQLHLNSDPENLAHGDLQLNILIANQGRLALDATISSQSNQVNIVAKLSDLVDGSLQVDISDPLNQLRWELSTDTLTSGTWAALETVFDTPLQLQAHLEGTDLTATGTIQLDGKIQQTGPFKLQSEVELSPLSLTLASATLWLPAWRAKLNLQGNLQRQDPLYAQFHVTSKQIHNLTVGTEKLILENLALEISGPLDKLALKLDGKIQTQTLAENVLSLRGVLTPEFLLLENLNLRGAVGSVRSTAKVSIHQPYPVEASLWLKDFIPEIFWPEIRGQISGQIKVKGQADPAKPQLNFSLASLSGHINNSRLDGGGDFSWSPEKWEARQLHLNVGDNRLFLNIRNRPQWHGEWNLLAQDLSDLLPSAAGSLVSHGKISGAGLLPELELEIQAEKLKYRTAAVDSIQGRIKLSADGTSNNELEIHIQNLIADQSGIWSMPTQVSVLGAGTPEQHSIQLSLQHSDFHTTAALTASLAEDIWSANIEQFTLEDPNLGSWLMPSNATLTADKHSVQLDSLCLSQQQASVCLQGSQKNDLRLAQLQSQQIPMQYLAPWMPNQIRLSGTVNSEISFQQKINNPMQVSASLHTGAVRVDFDSNELKPLDLTSIRGEFSIENDQLNYQGHLKFTESQFTLVQGTLENIKLGRMSPMWIKLDSEIDDLSWLSAFEPLGANFSGRGQSHLRFEGTFAQPLLYGTAEFDNLNYRLKDQGIDLQNGSAQLQAQGQKLKYSFKIKSTTGPLTINGQSQWQDLQDIGSEIFIRGEDFTLIDRSDRYLRASPNLRLLIKPKGIMLSGDLLVPKAYYAPRQLPQGAISASTDIVVEHEEAPLTNEIQLKTDINVRLGDQVSFNGFGLSTSLTGYLRVYGEAKDLIRASGQLNLIQGHYKAYGQDLTIESGQLYFAGKEISQPDISIRAVRQLENIKAGILATGPIQSPTVEIFSVPALPQTEALAYLILGRPLDQKNSDDGAVLAAAITSFGLDRSQLLAQQIAHRFGLDTIKVQGGETWQETAVAAGKYLTPRLYLSYGIGLFEASQQILLRYQINRFLQFQGVSGKASGADIFYRQETESLNLEQILNPKPEPVPKSSPVETQ